MAIEIVFLNTKEIKAARKQIVSVYRAVFTLPPYCEDEAEAPSFAGRLLDHAQRRGFRCCVARQDDQIVGFAYGFTATPGDGWWENVAERLTDEAVETWLMDCFAFAELAVIPSAQGRGIGGQLHDALLSGLPHRTAMLSAFQGETPALQLYRQRGWVTLLCDFAPPGSEHPYVVMGLQLPVAKNDTKPSRVGEMSNS